MSEMPSTPSMMKSKPHQGKPLIGITMGDPAGIGAEVIVKALADPDIRQLGRFVIYGLNEAIEYAADQAEVSPFWFRLPQETVPRIESGTIVADFDDLTYTPEWVHAPSAEGGKASMRFLETAIKAATRGDVEAIVTAPISKESWHMAGYRFPGHTERLGYAFRTRRVTMMFIGGKLRVSLATIHEPLLEIRNLFTIGRVFQPIDQMAEALRRWFNLEHPRIAVCGLNPHAGENGLFGDEERRIITPAITMAREAGWFVEGPFPADTIFRKALDGTYDGVVAMYHDQGLIPIKLLAFETSCQMTLGLPIVRTSVDHGTAFDIAGQNAANAESMKTAIRIACEVALRNRELPPPPPIPPDDLMHESPMDEDQRDEFD